MPAKEVGVSEFRENLAGYLEAGCPLTITQNGEPLGVFVPVKKHHREENLARMRVAAEKVDAMVESWGATEDDLVAEIEEMRRAERLKNRSGD